MIASNKQIIGFIILLGALALPSFSVSQPTFVVNADSTTPSFPSCNGFSGTIQAHYDYGTHAIVGNPDNQIGSDTVYDLGNANYIQCYCPLEGANGIQTNWLGAGSLDQAMISELMDQGWYYIGKGTDWGLDDMPFLAKNTDFSCRTAEVTPTPTISEAKTQNIDATPTPTVVPAVGGASANNNPTATPTQVPAATPTPEPAKTVMPAVKTLAATGTFIPTVMNSLFAAGVMLSSFSGVLYGKSKKS